MPRPAAWPRAPFVFAVVLAVPVLAAGCSDPEPADHGLCPQAASDAASGQFDLLLAPEASAAGPAADRASVTVAALPGQTLTATASWVPAAGFARIVLDAPEASGTSAQSPNAFGWSGKVAGGTYTMELVGDPLAAGVTASLALVASGCPAPV